MKKVLAVAVVFISLSITFFLPAQTHAAEKCSGYADVFLNDWYCEAVTALQDVGILAVKPEFNPGDNLNRAEGLKVIYEALGTENPNYNYPLFEMTGVEWFKKYFYAAYANHLIKANGGKMNPGTPITKGEFLTLYLQITDTKPSGYCTLKDTSGTPSSNWLTTTNMKGYLCKAQELGFATKDFDDKTMTRAVAMQIFYNSLQ